MPLSVAPQQDEDNVPPLPMNQENQNGAESSSSSATAPDTQALNTNNLWTTVPQPEASASSSPPQATSTTSTKTTTAPFRMQLKHKPRKRKLGQQTSFGENSSSSSGSSDDDEDEQQPPKRQQWTTSNTNKPTSPAVAAPPPAAPAPATTSTPVAAPETPVSPNASPPPAAEQHGNNNSTNLHQPEGWRVKLYRLNVDGSWDDCGTGRIVCLYRQAQTKPPADNNKNNNNNKIVPGSDPWLYQETGEATLCVQAEVTKQARQPRVLLRTRILLRDAYQRQGDNIITWCEPYYDPQQQNNNTSINNNNATNNNAGVDLALSFQDNAGCLDIWRQITHIQQRASELLRQQQQSSVEDMAAHVAAQHHADLQRQEQEQLWAHLGGGGTSNSNDPLSPDNNNNNNNMDEPTQQSLPNPPTLDNLEEIADTIAALQHSPQRDNLSMWIAKDECFYLKQLLALFPAAESKNDYGKLATLAASVKTILLLNDPSILDLVVTVANFFEQVCSCLEYDPDLREKANHRWFIRERAKFRTVVPMEDVELVSAIHRSFRVQYLRDTLLRPTMDESSLTTLSSIQTFTNADVVKGVMMSPTGKEVDLKDSYLVNVIRMLGVELHTLRFLEWNELENASSSTPALERCPTDNEFPTDPSIVLGKNALSMTSTTTTTSWKQYLAPQDRSMASRRLRKRGCLSFLRELFNMVRLSLQICDKDNFFPIICTFGIDLNEDPISDNVSQTSQIVEVGSVASTAKSGGGLEDCSKVDASVEVPMPHSPVTLLSLLGSVLSDPNTDVTEKGSVLEIISGIAMHDPSLIRHCCLEFHETWKKELAASSGGISGRPEANEKKQIVFFCPPNDLLASLLFLLDVETDAGVLLQVSEIMRIILDTDMMGDHCAASAGFADEAEPPASGQAPLHDQHNQPSGMAATSTEQKQFLALFYDHYVEWLVAPFQFTILHPVRQVPGSVLLNPGESPLMRRLQENFKKGVSSDDPLLKVVPPCAIRSSFAVELLSFCVRAHLYRMKFFLLKSRVLGNVLKLLRPQASVSGDRCLKLAALRLLRSILSVNDEFYHRHIIQHNLFEPVFEAFRANPVGDNLVSSAIVEMCDYIHSENFKSLIEYIVTKHLSASHPENTVPSLEDVSSPYVSTLTVLRQAYEANLMNQGEVAPNNVPVSPGGGSRYFGGGAVQQQRMSPTRQLSGKALEDQRKFQAVDQEESYFDSDDDDVILGKMSSSPPAAVDEVDTPVEAELHRTPRMFSLVQAPLLAQNNKSLQESGELLTDNDEEKQGSNPMGQPR